MTLEQFMDKLDNSSASDRAEVWVEVNGNSYLVNDVQVDDEGDVSIGVYSTPYV